MANLMDYLDWRGDLTLEISPFNEVDALILAELSFVDFDGIVPPPELGRGLPLNEAAEAFFALRASARQFGGIGSGIYPRARVPVPPRQRFALGLIQRRRVPVAAPLHFEHKLLVPPEHAPGVHQLPGEEPVNVFSAP